MKRYILCALRGKYLKEGGREHKLDISNEKCFFTITSVRKDNLVIEIEDKNVEGICRDKTSN